MGVPAKRGRPSSLKPEMVEQARKLCEFGATDKELADFLKVDVATIYRWKLDSPEFCEALKLGKEAADERVEKSLYHRAIGYSHPAVKIFNDEGEPLLVDYIEHYPPDTTAAIFWLKNRKRAEWRDAGPLDPEALRAVFLGIKIVIGSPDTTKGGEK
jgi:hypothetical protein